MINKYKGPGMQKASQKAACRNGLIFKRLLRLNFGRVT